MARGAEGGFALRVGSSTGQRCEAHRTGRSLGPPTPPRGTGERSLRIPPASLITLLGGIGLVTAQIGNLRCCAACKS